MRIVDAAQNVEDDVKTLQRMSRRRDEWEEGRSKGKGGGTSDCSQLHSLTALGDYNYALT